MYQSSIWHLKTQRLTHKNVKPVLFWCRHKPSGKKSTINSCSTCNPCCCWRFLQVFLYIYFPFLSPPVTPLDKKKPYSFLCSFTSCSQGQRVTEAICLMSVVLASLLMGYRHAKLSGPSPTAPTLHTIPDRGLRHSFFPLVL